MTLWIDNYKPLSLSKLDYHKDQAEIIRKLVSGSNFPHLLIYGPPGAGKKTRIQCILKELYGQGVEKLNLKQNEYETANGKKIDISLVVSQYHIEVNPSDVGFYDRVIVQELIKNCGQMAYYDKRQSNFTTIVIHEADRLTHDAQHALRRTMETHIKYCRIILCADTTSKLIPAIKSRCFPIRVAAPTDEQIISILKSVSFNESIQLPSELAKRIADYAKGNLRRAILALEMIRVQQYPFSSNQQIDKPEWQTYANQIARNILKEQTPANLLAVRKQLEELIVHCISPETILKSIVSDLVVHCSKPLQIQIYQLAAQYQYQMLSSSKSIFNLEAFVAKFMCLYKTQTDNDLMILDEDW